MLNFKNEDQWQSSIAAEEVHPENYKAWLETMSAIDDGEGEEGESGGG